MDNSNLMKQNRHSCYCLNYHLVLVTKYRNPAISEAVFQTIRASLLNIMEKNGCEVISLNYESDHIHLLFSAPPQVRLSSMVNNLKTVTSRLVRRDHAEWLKQIYWEPVFWSRSYYIGSVGDVTTAIVEAYIQNQGRE